MYVVLTIFNLRLLLGFDGFKFGSDGVLCCFHLRFKRLLVYFVLDWLLGRIAEAPSQLNGWPDEFILNHNLNV